MDLQALIKSGTANGKLELPLGEFFGQVVVDRPMTISGQGNGTWIGAGSAPTLKIVSPGVKLINLLIEITTGPDDVAVQADSGTNPVLEDVTVRGLTVGVPPENISTRITGAATESIKISFVPPPPISLTYQEPAPRPTSASVPTQPNTVSTPTQSQANSAPVSAGSQPQSSFHGFGIVLLIGFVGLIVYAGYYMKQSTQAEQARIAATAKEAEKLNREKAREIERLKREKEQEVERLKREQEREVERLKREREQEIERQRTAARENQDREIQQMISSGQARRVRSIVRGQIEHIGKFITKSSEKIKGGGTAISGNIQKGNSAWVVRSSRAEAVKAATESCEKNGSPCQDLYNVVVVNETSETMTIYIFHPWETDFYTNNSLWNWTSDAGTRTILNIREAGHLLVSKRFLIAADCRKVRRWWEPKPIEDLPESFGPITVTEQEHTDRPTLKITITTSP